jgi:hypothetical protein
MRLLNIGKQLWIVRNEISSIKTPTPLRTYFLQASIKAWVELQSSFLASAGRHYQIYSLLQRVRMSGFCSGARWCQRD